MKSLISLPLRKPLLGVAILLLSCFGFVVTSHNQNPVGENPPKVTLGSGAASGGARGTPGRDLGNTQPIRPTPSDVQLEAPLEVATEIGSDSISGKPDIHVVLTPPKGQSDYPSSIISANSYMPKMCRAEDGTYWAVVRKDNGAHPYAYFAVYKSTGDPASSNWQFLFEEYDSSNPYSYPDIEVVSSNNRGYVVYRASSSVVKCCWFQLTNPSNRGNISIKSNANSPYNCGITSDEWNYDGSSVYLYATWLELGNTTAYFSRSTNSGSTWTTSTVASDAGGMYTGNAITYCPGNDKIRIVFQNTNGNAIVALQSLTRGTGSFSTVQVIPGIISPAIASYGNTILVTAHGSNTGYDIRYNYSTNGGATWSAQQAGYDYWFIDWPGNQTYPSVTANRSGYFCMLYYNTDPNPMMRAAYSPFNDLMWWNWDTVDDTHYINGLSSACISEGSPFQYGGAFDTGTNPPSNGTSYFGWAGSGSAPATPTLISPIDAISGVNWNPTAFSWNASSGATSYHIQVATNSNFNPLVWEDSNVPNPSTSHVLTPGPHYYWHVKASNSFGSSAFSSTEDFTTANYPIVQDGDLLLDPYNYTLVWDPVPGISSYSVLFEYRQESSNWWPGSNLTVTANTNSLNLLNSNVWNHFPKACELNIKVYPDPFPTPIKILRVSYGKLIQPAVTSHQPVILVHGIMGDHVAWQNMANQIPAGTYDVWHLDYPNTGDIMKSAGVLKVAIDTVIARSLPIYLNDIKVISHSMGGLVARAYIQGMATNSNSQTISYTNHISALALIATPNKGARSADWLHDQFLGGNNLYGGFHASDADPAFQQLRTTSEFILQLNNPNYSGWNLYPQVYAVAGYKGTGYNYLFDLVTSLWPSYIHYLEEGLDHDCIVNTSSALWVGNSVPITSFHKWHHGFPYENDYFHHGDIYQPAPSSPNDIRLSTILSFLDSPSSPWTNYPPFTGQSSGNITGNTQGDEIINLNGSTVLLISSQNDTFRTFADEQGCFEFPFIPSGSYLIKSDADGFISQTTNIVISEQNPSIWQNLCLPFNPVYQGPAAPGISINNGALYTTSTNVTLNLSVLNATQVMVSTDPNFQGINWLTLPINMTLPFPFPSASGMIIFAKYRNSSMIESSVVVDAIEYTATAPSGSITVTSSPSGALIFIDGSSTGLVTPGTIQSLAAATYRISASIPNMIPDSLYRYVTIQNGGVGYANFTFTGSSPGTQISGNQSGTWYANSDPYYVIGEITVPTGQILTIQPGVQVIFQGHYKFIVNGILNAQGQLGDSISFTAQDTSTGWWGLRFINAQDSSHLSYCTIQYGHATNSGGPDSSMVRRGGGIYIKRSRPSIANCSIRNNTAYSGAGICCDSTYLLPKSNMTLTNCVITDNVTYSSGGGGVIIIDADPMIANCLISNNSANGPQTYTNGGGIFIISAKANSSPIITNCVLMGNSADYLGGGIYCDSTTATISNCTVLADTALSGGGIYLRYGSNIISRSLIRGNAAVQGTVGGGNGGGIFSVYDNPQQRNTILNCTISRNTATNYGGGIRLSNCPNILLINNIVDCNTGTGGVYFTSSSTDSLRYCDVWNNQGGNFTGSPLPPNLGIKTMLNANGDSCDIYHNIFLNPLFADTIGSNAFHLDDYSPCIDAGDPNSMYNDPDSTVADIGAYYYDQAGGVDFTYYLERGFNQISLPVNPANNHLLHLFPTATLSCWWYSSDDSTYMLTNQLFPSLAYWIEMPQADTLTVTGQPFPYYKRKVHPPWEMLGAVNSQAVPITTPPGGVIDSIWGYAASNYYQAANNLMIPGRGYFINLTTNTDSLKLGSPGQNGLPGAGNWLALIGGSQTPPVATVDALWQMPLTLHGESGPGAANVTLTLGGDSTTSFLSAPPAPPVCMTWGSLFGGDWTPGPCFVMIYPWPSDEDLTWLLSVDPNGNAAPYSTARTTVLAWDKNSLPSDGYFWMENYSTGAIVISDLREVDTLAVSGTQDQYFKIRWSNTALGINEDHAILPDHYILEQNAPNPFNSSTYIRYFLLQPGQVKLTVYNIRGQEVSVLVNNHQPMGYHSAQFDISGLASGIYIYRLESGEFVSTKKMLLLK